MSMERRLDRYSIFGLVFVLGWITCSSFYGLTGLWQVKNQLSAVQTTVIPKLVASRNCEHNRADQAVGALVTLSPQAIPSDCPAPPPVPKALSLKK